MFDFDGVLVDSEQLKRDALKENFLDFGEDFAQDVFEYQQETNCNRHDASLYAANKLGKGEEWQKEYSDKYTENVNKKIIAMPNMSTCESMLAGIVSKYPLYISSGTPQENLIEIVVKKTMRHLFKGIYGSPRTKIYHINHILKKEKLKPEEVLFVGDQEIDYKVAIHFGLDFLAINYRGDKSKVVEIDKLYDIVKYLDNNENMHTKFRASN